MGDRFRFLTAGESHGQALTVVVEGVPAGLPLDEDFIAQDLARRQRGYGRGPRMEIEKDRAQILSGVRYGLTIGSPVALLIPNKDWENWRGVMEVGPAAEPAPPVTRLRPGHADLPGALKYNLRDVRPIMERASARETVARVAAGAVTRRFLQEFGIECHSYVLAIGGLRARWEGPIDWEKVEASPLRTPDPQAEMMMMAAVNEARQKGDTLGGVFEVIASGVPIGLGSHTHWDRKLNARLAAAVMSINAVKGVEIGGGFSLAALPGSQVHDLFVYPKPGEKPWRRASNRAGGIEGGMSNGEDIVVRGAVKPIPTLGNPLPSLDLKTGAVVQAEKERSDVCVVPAAGVVAEAMVCLVLADAFLEKFGGDHLEETRRNYKAYMGTLKRF